MSDIGNEFGAGFPIGIEKLLSRFVRAEMSFILRRKKRRLMMIEPPRQPLRRRILEINDRIFIPVEHMAFEQEIPRAMQQSAIFNGHVPMNSFKIKTRERRCGGNAVEAMTMVENAQFHYSLVR